MQMRVEIEENERYRKRLRFKIFFDVINEDYEVSEMPNAELKIG